MTTNRQQTVVNTKPAPYYVPPYYAYPQYGYMPPPVYNPAYVDPNTYYPPPDDGTDYLYYPVDEYGQAIGPLSRDPPVNSRYHPYPDYVSNVATYGSYPPSPRRDQILHDNHYNYYYGGPYWHQSYGKPRDEALPPIRQEVFIMFYLF